MRLLRSASEAETQEIARRLGAAAFAGAVVTLTGDLGAGKTVFARGFAAGLDSPSAVVSPTYVLVAVIEDGRLPLWHVDLYRLAAGAAVDDLGLEDAAEGVLLIEWPDRLGDDVPALRLDVRIDIEDDRRLLTIEAIGERYLAWLDVLGR
jgi:tRNA threonylcarbamoyladenosine biosynthesis protein TsaE